MQNLLFDRSILKMDVVELVENRAWMILKSHVVLFKLLCRKNSNQQVGSVSLTVPGADLDGLRARVGAEFRDQHVRKGQDH